jgi:hypothetical protein
LDGCQASFPEWSLAPCVDVPNSAKVTANRTTKQTFYHQVLQMGLIDAPGKSIQNANKK